MLISKGPRKQPSGERDERKTKIIQATADARDWKEGKGKNCTATSGKMQIPRSGYIANIALVVPSETPLFYSCP